MHHPLDEALACHCAPALAGIKAGNLVSLSGAAIPGLDRRLEEYRQALRSRGVRFEVLCVRNGRTLLLVFRPELLERCLARPEARRILARAGYPGGPLPALLERLKSRLAAETGFPHEIGLFLDYPPADVEGFQRWGGRNCKLCGHWKVYADVEQARRLFQRYDRCRAALLRRVAMGITIPQLFAA